MWIMLYSLDWIALSIVIGVMFSVIAHGGWEPFWQSIREVFAPSNVSEHGDLSEGR